MQSTFSLPGPEEHAAWLKGKRRQFQRLLAGPEFSGPIHGAVRARHTEPTMTIERVEYDGEPGERISALLMIPAGRSLPLPTIICLHEQGDDFAVGKSALTAPQGIATELCRRGYLVLAPEVPGYEERQNLPFDPESGRLLLQGWSLPAKLVWEVSRAIDYLDTRTEAERGRVGLLGMAMGGLIGWLAGAAEPRLATLAICWGASTYAAILRHEVALGPTGWLPGLLNWGDAPEVCSLIAPRPLFFCAAQEDSRFPFDGFEELFWRVRQLYTRLGEEDKLGQHLCTTPAWDSETRAQVANWFDRWL
jgi:dienelactone hydrolase